MSTTATAPVRDAAYASQWQLTVRRFSKHRIAVLTLWMLIILYGIALFSEFFAPYSSEWNDVERSYAPPQMVRWDIATGFYTRAVVKRVDEVTFRQGYVEDSSVVIPLGFFVKGEAYKLWGLIPADRHFFSIDKKRFDKLNYTTNVQPVCYLLGADKLGRDVLSRILHGARISLSVGLVGIFLSFVLGLVIGGISGYLGGAVDNVIQRFIEVLNSFPKLPLWLALGAAFPPDWSPLRIYFMITIVLSIFGWTGLARVVRGKILSLREEDYATAARLMGASHPRIIFKHLLPGFTSHIIVSLTLSFPGMILGETSLSFLGLGLRPPIVSWGVMLQDCMNIQAVVNYPWLLLPSVFIIITVLCYNYLGDGLRDAADPYAER
ncbi:MAG: ABC transporter permease [Spirochaetes bacterium]|nr:ABC transporter permease [Spirochaetota bacterium]